MVPLRSQVIADSSSLDVYKFTKPLMWWIGLRCPDIFPGWRQRSEKRTWFGFNETWRRMLYALIHHLNISKLLLFCRTLMPPWIQLVVVSNGDEHDSYISNHPLRKKEEAKLMWWKFCYGFLFPTGMLMVFHFSSSMLVNLCHLSYTKYGWPGLAFVERTTLRLPLCCLMLFCTPAGFSFSVFMFHHIQW